MFADINSILSRVTKRSGIKSELKSTECLRLFTEEMVSSVGLEAANKVKALYVKDQIITIASLCDQVSADLRRHEAVIIEKINARMGEKYLTIIRYLS